MVQHQINGGKGKSRVQIAQDAVDRLEGLLAAARTRLEKAIAQEEARGDKRAEKAAAALNRARKAMAAAGMSEAQIAKALKTAEVK